ncbi:glutathione S-transferase [Gammaproteobacteria bacterium]|nr:glutathione S-transferase [Gammaproteobacteria bacterium]MDB3908300.1 glutathione S-transferase [Gammaproteobacteria bacterium]MDC0414663.1 glutathione S-transferase [Gammaproteobacteria bacterium]
MSIKLHGMAYSNYYNMVKAIMIEKGMQFEEVHVLPNQESDFLQKSPMGKVPCMETDQGFLTETGVMIDYVDSLQIGPSLYPEDPFARAKVQELIRHLELYIELPARRLYGDVFFGRPADDELKEQVRLQLEKGFASLQKLAKFDPYLAGAELSYADFYYRFSVGLATIVCKKALAWDALREVPNIKALLDLMDECESIQKVQADQAKNA